jgi:phosphate-selective porin OprO/OprP
MRQAPLALVLLLRLCVWGWPIVAAAGERLPPVSTPAVTQAAAQSPLLPTTPLLAAQPSGESAPPLLNPLEERLQAMERRNEQLEAKFGAIEEENVRLSRQLENFSSQEAAANRPLPRGFDDQPDDIRTDQPEPSVGEDATIPTFGEGFKWETKDEEYSLVFHNETQLDLRAYGTPNSFPVNQFGFYTNRMRMYFNGHLTKPIEYSVSINKGLGNLDMLDSYMNFNYDKRVQFRVGRYRVPYTYDWYALSNQFLSTPERSVFAVNYGYNRNWALMVHGEIMDDSAEYAVAVANGPRNSYFDDNAAKDVLAYFNVRPFEHSTRRPGLKNLNLGGSLGYGIQDQFPKPFSFRTSTNATDSEGAERSVPVFLQLNDGVQERGLRSLWELHAAYYYRHLSLLAAWDTGFNSYALGPGSTPLHVPTYGYHVQFGYFLTGEEVERRTFVKPLRPFDLRPGKRGSGAVEIQARYDDFVVGNEIFTAGFADPGLWTNRVQTIDAGVNWYLNMFTRIQFDWQHAIYANPVVYRPGAFQSSNDLFWVRFQIYF